MDVKATLSQWALIELCTSAGDAAELVVYGIPSKAPDEFVLTSAVDLIEQEGDDSAFVTTQNSLYRVVGPGRHYQLPLMALPLLREGQDPGEIAKRYGREDRKPGYVKRALEQRKRLKF
ncbi:hypothetical protein [Marinobacterium lacunae]|uniref:hypothetical protein n=1 Tax=Marinobacterium lacunae TaxID=1232683 RepID=UPI00055D4370|nr:hypothetical protein [Marinobacterium lacunae]